MEKHLTFNGSTIYYRVIGEGMPVILLHGFGEDGTIWDSQVSHLKNKYQLVVPDIPGSGKSSLLTTNKPGMEDYACCVKAILDQENISKSVLIGHSMGGYIALAFAEKFPEQLIAFGLFHSSAYADDEVKIDTRKKAISFIKNNGAGAFLNTSIPGLFMDSGKSAADLKTLLEKGNNFTPEALIQYYEAMISRPDRTSVLKHAELPVLMIMGVHDKAVPFNFSLKQAHLPKCTYILILRKSAHMGMLEEMNTSNHILADFLHFSAAN